MTAADRRQLVGALVLGAAGGAVFAWAGLPLPWMLGAMSATIAGSMSGLPLAVPDRLRFPMLGVLGVLLGSGFTADVAAGMARWAGSLAALPVYILVSIGVGLLFLRRVARLDPVSAYFAAAPGGLSEMTVLGERAGGDLRTISLIHSTRIFAVVFAVPFIVRWLESRVAATLPAAVPPTTGADLLVLAACLVVGLWLAPRLRLPVPFLLGPLLLSAAAHVTGLVAVAPPRLVVVVAQIVIGASLGCRFSGVRLARIGHLLVIGAALGLLLLGVAAGTAGLLNPLVGVGYVALLLAFSPGGIAEMGIIAVALGIDPLFVATHHVARIGLVVIIAPWLYRRARPTSDAE